ncbi:Hsp70 family protein [Lentzea sp. NPDC005914]|uniref:Hsp70 family protein n=1 Tax=Lentzea sp. NPDC005914 TaxID=3154572 RepID=UPI0034088685
MTYPLGVDIGTTYTAAALWRDGRVETVPLGDRANAVPSVLFLRQDGTMMIGDAAAHRGIAEPERQMRQFKRRMGDDIPVMVGGNSFLAHDLLGFVLRWTVDKVSERQGGPPGHVVLTHPAQWGDYRRGLLVEAARSAGLPSVGLLPEPVAAATWYAAQERVEPGAQIGIYDLGGGTFDASVVHKTATGVEIHGESGGDDSIGGVDFDHALFRHVGTAAGVDVTAFDPADRAAAAGLAHLLQSVVEAKEALSTDIEALISVVLPGITRQVLVTRADFESLIRARVQATVGAFGQVVSRAGVDPTRLHTVLLVGGSSRIPLVRQLLSREFGAGIAVDAHPKYTVSLGAAIAAAPRIAPPPEYRPRPPASPPRVVPSPVVVAVAEQVDLAKTGLTAATDVRVPMGPSAVAVRTSDKTGSRSRGRWTAAVTMAAVATIGAGVVYVVSRDREESTAPDRRSSAISTPAVPLAGTLRLSGALITAPDGADVVRSVTLSASGEQVAVGLSEKQQPRSWFGGAPVDVPFENQGALADVVAGAGKFVAVGWTGTGPARRAAVWTSAAGRSWTLVPPGGEIAPGAPVKELTAVVVGPDGRFLAFGVDRGTDRVDGDVAVLASADGVVWSRVPAVGLSGTGPQSVSRVARVSDGLVAVGAALAGARQGPAVWTSVDGIAWQQSPYVPDGAPTMTGIAQAADGVLWACGSVGTTDRPAMGCWRQVDRQKWERWDVRPETDVPQVVYSYGLIKTPNGLLLGGVGHAGTATDAAVWRLST